MPISYSTNEEAALGFARKGHTEGCVYSVLADLDSVLIADLDELYKEGGLHLENEVVIWHKTAVPILLLRPTVTPQQPVFRSRHGKDKWLEEMQRLRNVEKA